MSISLTNGMNQRPSGIVTSARTRYPVWCTYAIHACNSFLFTTGLQFTFTCVNAYFQQNLPNVPETSNGQISMKWWYGEPHDVPEAVPITPEIKCSLPWFTGYSAVKFHWSMSITFSAISALQFWIHVRIHYLVTSVAYRRTHLRRRHFNCQ